MQAIRDRICLIFTAAFLLYLWLPWALGAAAGADPQVRRKAQLDGMRTDPKFYVGFGHARYQPPDVGDARKQAVAQAEADLEQNIRRRVERQAKGILRYDSRHRSQAAERSFDAQIRSFAKRELRRRREVEFADYPQRGDYTIALFLLKNATDRDLETEINSKRDIVVTEVNEAAIASMSRNWALAVRSYVEARDDLLFFFEDIPIQAVVTGKPAEVVLARHIDEKLRELVSRIELVPVHEPLAFAGDGRLKSPVVIEARYPFEEGARPIPGLPMKAAFYKGNGRLSRDRLSTDALGKAQLPLEWVDAAAAKEVVLEVSIDTAALSDMPRLDQTARKLISLRRSKSMAYSVLFRADERLVRASKLEEGMRVVLLQAGFDTVAVQLDRRNLEDPQFEAARKSRADYLLVVNVDASTRADPEFNMYAADARSSFIMYTLPDGAQAAAERGPAATGRSSSVAKAVSYATDKISPDLLRQLKEKITDLH